MMRFQTLEDINVANKIVLVRGDLNVPMQGGKVTDDTRIKRLLPTIRYLIKKKSRVVLLSHFGRPKGKPDPSLSLAPLVDALSAALDGKEIQFGVDCVGDAARKAVDQLQPGDVLLLENLRFHVGEEKGNAEFARELAALGDVYVNDAFSCSHRAHASITGIAAHLPAAAGRLMQGELEMLGSLVDNAERPMAAMIGGAKVSTKIDLLKNLACIMDVVLIGGAMANTFLAAQGRKVGQSMYEPDAKQTALSILKHAEKHGCRLVLPVDAVVASEFRPQAECAIADVRHIPARGMIVDIGPATVELFVSELRQCRTVVWNGPLGAFEISPFDASSVSLARSIAALTAAGKLRSIAGGGDTLAALAHAGLAQKFTYLSTAGGAFLEWMEGKTLPGVAVLIKAKPKRAAKKPARKRRAGGSPSRRLKTA